MMRHLRVALSLVATLLVTIATDSAQAKPILSRIFSDGAILQRGKPVAIFGTAAPQELVTVSIAGQAASTKADSAGNFSVSLGPFLDGSSHDLQVMGGQTVHNIRFGEVWLVAGDLTVDGDKIKAPTESALDSGPGGKNQPPLKVFRARVNYGSSPLSQLAGQWQNFAAADLESGNDYVARAFALKLSKKIDHPIGIVEIEGPKAPLRAWISKRSLEAKADTRAISTKYTVDGENFKVLKEQFDKGKLSPELAGMASGIHNGMIAPLANFTARGIIWRQGLGDLQSALNYKLLLPVLISDLRTSLKQEQLPLILVQLGAIAAGPTKGEDTASLIRLYQTKARLAPKTYVVPSLDLEREDKKTGMFECDLNALSDRLTAVALSTQYQIPTPYQSPVVELVEPEGNSLKLTLRHVGKGMTSKDNKITGFAVAGWDHKFVDAEASMEDDTIVVTSDQVRQPRFVRYGWGNSPTLSLFNSDGLPLAPFSSDR